MSTATKAHKSKITPSWKAPVEHQSDVVAGISRAQAELKYWQGRQARAELHEDRLQAGARVLAWTNDLERKRARLAEMQAAEVAS